MRTAEAQSGTEEKQGVPQSICSEILCVPLCISPISEIQPRWLKGILYDSASLRRTVMTWIIILIAIPASVASCTNSAGSMLDGYLTVVGCDKLFEFYAGSASSALCTIHLGPIAPRATSARKKIAPGRYRLFLQAWTANPSSVSGSLDMGLWSPACKWKPISP